MAFEFFLVPIADVLCVEQGGCEDFLFGC